MRLSTSLIPARRGITLTECLIAIMILGVGLVSLATLFPIGLVRLRDAQRFSRSTFLVESAEADIQARGLLNRRSFSVADSYNLAVVNQSTLPDFPLWYISPSAGPYVPWLYDTPFYGGDWKDPTTGNILGAHHFVGPGLPVAYDPLWRFQTGNYLDPINGNTPEYRFADGSLEGIVSAHGLQRVTNFNRASVVVGGITYPIMPRSSFMDRIFVSLEDVVWQESTGEYLFPNLPDPLDISRSNNPITAPSPLLPDLTIDRNATGALTLNPVQDWRYTWMFTGQQSDVSDSTRFDGDIVIFENRQFGGTPPTPSTPARVDGERVVEAVFGYSTGNFATAFNLSGTAVGGFGNRLTDRTVLLRWPDSQPDLEIRPGHWIADVTYERDQTVAQTRFPLLTSAATTNSPPAQRCYWYRATKVVPVADPYQPVGFKAVVVHVQSPLRAKTLMDLAGSPPQPLVRNAAFFSSSVVAAIPRNFTQPSQ